MFTQIATMIVVLASAPLPARDCSCPKECRLEKGAIDAQGFETLILCPEQPLDDVILSGVEQLQEQEGRDAIKATKIDEKLWMVKRRPGIPSPLTVFGPLDADRRGLAYEEPNFAIPLLGAVPAQPTKDEYKKLWSLSGSTSDQCAANTGINLPEALKHLPSGSTPGSPSTVVALVDNGLSAHEDELLDNLWRNPKESEEPLAKGTPNVDDDGNGFFDDIHGVDVGLVPYGLRTEDLTGTKSDSHGTRVASIAGAIGNNGKLVSGVVWSSPLLLCRYQPDQGLLELLQCLKYFVWIADEYKDQFRLVAVNLSLGTRTCSCCVEREIEKLRDRGVIVVAGAGNEGTDNDAADGTCPYFPAGNRVSNIISVAASDCREKLAKTSLQESNFGNRSVHIAAPGDDIDVVAGSGSNMSAKFAMTSAAAPHVAGLISLIRAYDSGLEWPAVRNRILAGGTPNLPHLADKTISGRRLRVADPCPTEAPACTGALTCRNQRLCRRVEPAPDATTVAKGTPVKVVALSINCATPGPTPVAHVVDANGALIAQIPMRDTGPTPPAQDDYAGDGEFTGEWTTTTAGTYHIDVCGSQAERLEVKVSQ